jgi:hypothetical protein
LLGSLRQVKQELELSAAIYTKAQP